MRLQGVIQQVVHRHRPRMRDRDGDELLADLMRRLAADAWQRAPWEEVDGLPSDEDTPENLRDEESLRMLRFLLRCMSRLGSS